MLAEYTENSVVFNHANGVISETTKDELLLVKQGLIVNIANSQNTITELNNHLSEIEKVNNV